MRRVVFEKVPFAVEDGHGVVGGGDDRLVEAQSLLQATALGDVAGDALTPLEATVGVKV